jgi:hypothetical protein
MQPANLINALQAYSRGAKPLITADAHNLVSPIEPGQQLQGAVQSQVSSGLFKVLVAGQSLQMRLPDGVRTGDILSLRVVSKIPPLTFSIAASTAPISTQEQISAAARLIANLAELPLERPVTQKLVRTAVAQTLAAAPEIRQLATALRDALSHSGLFYESHQAQWVRGERSTAQLLVEPQNQLMDKNIAALAKDQSARITHSGLSVLPNDQNSPTANTSTAADTQSDSLPAAANALPIAKELLPLVQQQLHALETHQITWTGQVWPGQDMQWEIQGQPEQNTAQRDERRWSTEMELAMSKLGDVHAKLVFSAQGLKLTLQAADPATTALFNRAMPKLQAALADVHIPLLASAVEKT